MTYIQIILKKRMNKQTYFLKQVAGVNELEPPRDFTNIYLSTIYSLLGTQCNYKVTSNDRAWNVFLKKGDFQQFFQ